MRILFATAMVVLLFALRIGAGTASVAPAYAADCPDGAYDAATYAGLGGFRVGRDWLIPWDDGRYGLAEATTASGCWLFFWADDAPTVMEYWIGRTNPPPTFCYIMACIPNFDNGRGYVVQCRDGTFSKSGGIRGACNYHGGPS